MVESATALAVKLATLLVQLLLGHESVRLSGEVSESVRLSGEVLEGPLWVALVWVLLLLASL